MTTFIYVFLPRAYLTGGQPDNIVAQLKAGFKPVREIPCGEWGLMVIMGK